MTGGFATIAGSMMAAYIIMNVSVLNMLVCNLLEMLISVNLRIGTVDVLTSCDACADMDQL